MVGSEGAGASVSWRRFPKRLERPDMLCWLSLALAEATDGGLKCFLDVKVNVSGLEGPAF